MLLAIGAAVNLRTDSELAAGYPYGVNENLSRNGVLAQAAPE
jgi:hypothetical protein